MLQERSIPACDVLCVGAHPDDVEMAMGGTVAGLVAAGRSVTVVDLTRGELGTYGDADTRLAESEVAAEVLGVKRLVLDLPDGGVTDDLDTRHRLARILRRARPRLVFAPYPHARTGPLDGRANVDHLATGLLVREATKLARFRKLMPDLEPHATERLLYYMIPDDVRPSFVVDVSAQRKKIEASIRAYSSQMQIERGGRNILDLLMLLREHAGLRIRTALGESFLTEDPLGGDADLLMKI